MAADAQRKYYKRKLRYIASLECLIELEDALAYNFNLINDFGDYEAGMKKAYNEVFHIINIMKERYLNE